MRLTQQRCLFPIIMKGNRHLFFFYRGNSSGFPIEEKNNDAQLAGLMFIAAQSARVRRMRIAHSFLSYRRYSVKICDFMKKQNNITPEHY